MDVLCVADEITLQMNAVELLVFPKLILITRNNKGARKEEVQQGGTNLVKDTKWLQMLRPLMKVYP